VKSSSLGSKGCFGDARVLRSAPAVQHVMIGLARDVCASVHLASCVGSSQQKGGSMAVSYIQNIYNNTNTTFYMWAQDSEHLGTFTNTATGASVGNNDNGNILTIPPGAKYSGSWAGVPWYNGSTTGASAHFRAISTSNDKTKPCLYLIQSNVGGSDGISYYNSGTGMQTDRQDWGADKAGDKFNFSLIFNSADSSGIVMQMDNSSHNILYYIKQTQTTMQTMGKDLLNIATQIIPLVV
jgi:hypothetical protein